MTGLIDVNKRLTRHQKEKNNFRAIREKMDMYDTWYGYIRDEAKIKNMQINYGLFNGKLDVSLYDDPVCFNIGKETVTFDYQNISHYPVISQIANAIVGEQEERPFKPMVKDNTPEKRTYQKAEYNKSTKQYINQNLQKQKQGILQQVSQKYGITDIYSLSPEEQKQLSHEVEQQTIAQTPEQILNFLKNDYQSPTAMQAQKMADFLVEYHNIWRKQINGFKHAVITGEEYYYEGVRNGELVFEDVHPMNFEWGGSQRVEDVQHGTWARYENWFTPQDITQRHFKELTEKDIEDLFFCMEPIGGFSHRRFTDWDKNQAQKMLMYKFSTDKGFQERYGDINIKNQSGQRKIRGLYQDVFGKSGNIDSHINNKEFGIREAHIVWRDKRILKQVTRYENNQKVNYWVDEHYEPQDEDKKITRRWIDEVWEGYKLGSFDSKYVGLRPIPYQYRSLSNPNNVDLPYYGKRYSTHGNVTKNCSVIDLGKTLQKDFDITIASIKHDMQTDMGNVFMTYLNLIPENMKWQDWLDVMRNAGIMLADPHKRGLNGLDPQFLKSFNLSKAGSSAYKLQMAEFFRTSLARTMYFNDVRLGEIGQYANQRNTESNQTASYKQTSLLFSTHNQIVEDAMQAFLNRGRFYYKDNLDKAAVFLDDLSLAELASGSRSSYTQMGLTLNNDPSDVRKLSILKQQTFNFIQNPQSLTSGIIDLLYADTESEVRAIMKREKEDFEKKRQEAMQAAQKQEEIKAQGELQKETLKQDRQDARENRKLMSQERREELNSRQFQFANDVNSNQQSDLIEKSILELQAKMKINEDQLEFKREELEVKKQAGKMRL